ncbi:MAG: hypothetical protein WCK51_04310 [Armatimonadota bacterium]
MARIRSNVRRSKSNFPWLWLVLLIGSIYLFWIMPRQRPPSIPTLTDVATSNPS